MFLERFRQASAPRLGVRAHTFNALFDYMGQQKRSLNIVETGCLRMPGNWEGDGQSTFLFDCYINDCEGNFWSVDISPDSIAGAKQMVSPKTNLICENSLTFLSNFKEPIDVLYLDSFDLDMKVPHLSAEHHLLELMLALPKLSPKAVVIVDDTYHEDNKFIGKGSLVGTYMQHRGAKLLAEGYQDVWIIP